MRVVRCRLLSILAVVASVASGPVYASPDAALGRGLSQLVASWESGDPRLSSQLKLHITSTTGDHWLLVHFAPGADVATALKQLQTAGFRLTTRSSINPSLVGRLPAARRRSRGRRYRWLRSLHATQRPIKHAGAAQSQAVALEKADRVQAQGIDGKGIRVGVLSDSFDTCTFAFCLTHAADERREWRSAAARCDGAGRRCRPQRRHGRRPPPCCSSSMTRARCPARLFQPPSTASSTSPSRFLRVRNTFKADVVVDDVIYFDEADVLGRYPRAGGSTS